MSHIRKGAVGTAALLTASIGIAGTAHADDIYVKNTKDAGPGSLRSAIDLSNATAAEDRILFASRVSGEISLESDLARLESTVTIQGPGRNRLRVDGNDDHQIFYVSRTAEISGMTLLHAGRVPVDPPPPVECSPMPLPCHGDPYYAPPAGAIAIGDGGSLVVEGVRFSANSGDIYSAISAEDVGSLRITDSEFERNGGAIAIDDAANGTRISGSTFHDNVAGYASPIDIGGGDLHVEDSEFTGNTGGALHLVSTAATIRNSVFSDNANTGGGGAVHVLGGSLDVSESVFRDNSSRFGGGGAISIDPFGEDSSIRASTIVGNRTGTENAADDRQAGGGGIFFGGWDPQSSLTVENVTLTGNRSINGEGGGIQSRGELSLDSVTITGNSVKELSGGKAVRGGGLNVNEGEATIRNSIISGNTSGGADDLSDLPHVPGYPPDVPPRFDISYSLLGDIGDLSPAEIGGPSNLIGEDPELGSLRNNGGPTPTMIPRPGSPVVNRGSTELRVDQRGYGRPAEEADIGSVELQKSSLTIGRVTLDRRRGTATLRIKTNGPGRVVLKRSGSVRKSAAPIGSGQRVGLRVKARGPAAARLRDLGRATVRATVRFVSVDGSRSTRSRFVKLVKRPG